jgi:hypothetical protein
MSDLITRYERHLYEAARRELAPGGPQASRRSVKRLAVAAGVGALLVSVPAAADNGWFPFSGRSDAPSSSDSPPASSLTGMLGVLRRPQTAADRGGDTEFALRFVGDKTYEGVQLDYVRRAVVGPGDEGVVIIPSVSHRQTPEATPNPQVVCVWRSDYFRGEPVGGQPGCYSADDIRRGAALQQLGHRVDMVVPDEVARVEAVSDSGSVDSSIPEDNVASWDGSLPKRVIWYDGSGKTVRSVEPGSP